MRIARHLSLQSRIAASILFASIRGTHLLESSSGETASDCEMRACPAPLRFRVDCALDHLKVSSRRCWSGLDGWTANWCVRYWSGGLHWRSYKRLRRRACALSFVRTGVVPLGGRAAKSQNCTLHFALDRASQVGRGDGLRSDRVPSYRLLANASKAVLLWINSMESFKRTICRFFRSAKRRVTVSREVPIIWAISS
jgi:hypothetical protein